MSFGFLPSRIKIGIRDQWDNSSSPVQRAITNLTKLVGYPVVVEPQWKALWDELQGDPPDAAHLVPSVARPITTWCSCLSALLKDEKNSTWNDELISRLKTPGKLRLFIEVGSGSRPTTRWATEKKAFVIMIPKSPTAPLSTVFSAFSGDFLSTLKKEEPPAPPQVRGRPSSVSKSDDTWTDLESETASINITSVASSGTRTPNGFVVKAQRPDVLEIMPTLDSIPPPEHLFRRPPYHLIMRHISLNKEIIIQSSHEPTLKLMAAYLKRWYKGDGPRGSQKTADIQLIESPLSQTVMYDRLVIKANNSDTRNEISPTLLLSFVEGVLGYRMMFGDASFWTFVKETEYRAV